MFLYKLFTHAIDAAVDGPWHEPLTRVINLSLSISADLRIHRCCLCRSWYEVHSTLKASANKVCDVTKSCFERN